MSIISDILGGVQSITGAKLPNPPAQNTSVSPAPSIFNTLDSQQKAQAPAPNPTGGIISNILGSVQSFLKPSAPTPSAPAQKSSVDTILSPSQNTPIKASIVDSVLNPSNASQKNSPNQEPISIPSLEQFKANPKQSHDQLDGLQEMLSALTPQIQKEKASLDASSAKTLAELNAEKNTLDTTDQTAVDSFNAKVYAFNNDPTKQDYNAKVDHYNNIYDAYAKLQGVVNTPLSKDEIAASDAQIQKKSAKNIGTGNIIKNTIEGLPKAAWDFLGVGKIQDYLSTSQGQEAAANLTGSDFANAVIPAVGKVVGAPVADIAGIFTGPKVYHVPIVGDIPNIQQQAKDAVMSGKNPYEAIVDSAPQAIFDGLMVAGLAEKVFSPREATVASGTQPAPIKFGPEVNEDGTLKQQAPVDKSFKLTKPVQATTKPLPPEALKLLQDQGMTMTGYDATKPAYFKITPQIDGTLKGEVIQIKPSLFNTFVSKFGGNIYNAPASFLNSVGGAIRTVQDLKNSVGGEGGYVKNPFAPDVPGEGITANNTGPISAVSRVLDEEAPIVNQSSTSETPIVNRSTSEIPNNSGESIRNALNQDAVKYQTTPEEIQRVFPDYVPPSVNEQMIRKAFPDNADHIIELSRKADRQPTSKNLDALEEAAGNPEVGTPQFKALYGTTDPKEVSDFFNFKISVQEYDVPEIQSELPNLLRDLKNNDPIANEKAKIIGENFTPDEVRKMTQREFTSRGYTSRDIYDLEELYPGLFKATSKESSQIGSDTNVATNDTATVTPTVNTKKQAKIDLLHRQLQRTADSLRSALANPEGHAKAYPQSTPAVYRSRIAELNTKLDALMSTSSKTDTANTQTIRSQRPQESETSQVPSEQTQLPLNQTRQLPSPRTKDQKDFSSENLPIGSKVDQSSTLKISPKQEKEQNLIQSQNLSSQTIAPNLRVNPEPNVSKQVATQTKQKAISSDLSYNKFPLNTKLPSTTKSIGKLLDTVKYNGVDKTRGTIPIKTSQLPVELAQKSEDLSQKKEAIQDSPYRNLLKYIAKSGEFQGKLPEVGTGGTSEFARRGDEIIQQHFGSGLNSKEAPDSELIRSGMDDYLQQRRALFQEIRDYKKDVADFKASKRNEIREQRDQKALDEEARLQSQPLQETLHEITPPEARGGIQSPRLNFASWHDIPAFRQSRDTFERNLEKVAPKEDVAALKRFIVDPIKKNDTDMINYTNKIKTEAAAKMKELGIKRNSIEDKLIQKYGEGIINHEQLTKEVPGRATAIMEAAKYYRGVYDKMIDDWNRQRKIFGYKDVPKRPDYFRHFDDIGWFTKTVGFLRTPNELPTSIAGESINFNPGKPFTTAELRREGNKTSYSAIGGLQNYIDSVGKQMFHIDSIQRGRALQKYLQISAEVSERTPDKLQLGNFKTQLKNYVNTGLAGKLSSLDRTIEEYLGRHSLNVIAGAARYIGRNIIVGNVSAALSHLVTLPLNFATVEKVPLARGLLNVLTAPLREGPSNTIDGQISAYLTRRFPTKYIVPSKWEKTEEALKIVMTIADRFKTHLAVASKYHEGIAHGMAPEQAMKEADEYAGRVIGDNSTGQVPNLMQSRSAGVLAQFQRGLNDSISVLAHDIPQNAKETRKNKETGKDEEKINKRKLASAWIQFALYSYFTNEIYKHIRGSGKGIDPIGLGLTIAGLNDEGSGQSFGGRAKTAANDLAGELPFTNLFVGGSGFPLSPISQYAQGKESGKNALEAIGALVLPTGGGLQAKKTLQGLEQYKQGYGTTAGGKPAFPIAKTPANAIRAAIFGPSATPEAQAYYNSSAAKKSQPANPMLDLAKQIQDLDAAGKTDESDALIEKNFPQTPAGDAAYAQYQSAKTQLKNQESTANTDKYLKEVLDSGIVQKVKALDAAGKTDESDQLLNDMFPDTPEGNAKYDAYTAAKAIVKTADSTFSKMSDDAYDKQTFIHHVYTAAVAAGEHPIQFFDNVFHRAGDWHVTGVENGQVMVHRLPELGPNGSKVIRENAGENTPEFRLDHTIPLEIGGSNRSDNLQMMTTDEWASNTPVEDYLGAALKAGTITGPKAREYAIRFKNGLGEDMSAALKKEYQEKYGGIPITFDEIRAAVEGK